jgi:hypothetical protein
MSHACSASEECVRKANVSHSERLAPRPLGQVQAYTKGDERAPVYGRFPRTEVEPNVLVLDVGHTSVAGDFGGTTDHVLQERVGESKHQLLCHGRRWKWWCRGVYRARQSRRGGWTRGHSRSARVNDVRADAARRLAVRFQVGLGRCDKHARPTNCTYLYRILSEREVGVHVPYDGGQVGLELVLRVPGFVTLGAARHAATAPGCCPSLFGTHANSEPPHSEPPHSRPRRTRQCALSHESERVVEVFAVGGGSAACGCSGRTVRLCERKKERPDQLARRKGAER